jgi:hypothetical protein
MGSPSRAPGISRSVIHLHHTERRQRKSRASPVQPWRRFNDSLKWFCRRQAPYSHELTVRLRRSRCRSLFTAARFGVPCRTGCLSKPRNVKATRGNLNEVSPITRLIFAVLLGAHHNLHLSGAWIKYFQYLALALEGHIQSPAPVAAHARPQYEYQCYLTHERDR